VPLTAIVVRVIRPGRRADDLLAAVANELGRNAPRRGQRGDVRILLEEFDTAAWKHVHDALDAAGHDWQEHLRLNPRRP
jgi:hypothetical protein